MCHAKLLTVGMVVCFACLGCRPPGEGERSRMNRVRRALESESQDDIVAAMCFINSIGGPEHSRVDMRRSREEARLWLTRYEESHSQEEIDAAFAAFYKTWSPIFPRGRP